MFVSLDGRWKLSGFECAQELHNTHHWVQSDFVRSVKDSTFSPPEDEVFRVNFYVKFSNEIMRRNEYIWVFICTLLASTLVNDIIYGLQSKMVLLY